jgi:outer membrane protein TolC
MAEVSLTLPWLNRSRHDSEIAQAEASQSLQLAEYEALRSAVLQQIQEALVYCEAASDLVKLYRETLRPQAQATFKAASAAYQTDRTDFLNLLDAQTTLLEVEYGYYKALAEFDQRWAELELAVGAPVERARQQEMEVLP